MSQLFDIVGSINDHKRMEYEKEDYNSYIINHHFSYSMDTVLPANEMNRLWAIPNEAQYEYLFSTIRQRRRFSKWIKVPLKDQIQDISKYYKVNVRKAAEIHELLSAEMLEQIRKIIDDRDSTTKR